MRILELGKFYPPERGGIETLLRLWSEGLVARGVEVDCVVANRRPERVRETVAGVRVHRLASFGEVFSTSMCPAYLGATRRYPADLWHVHFPNPLADLAVLAGARRTPVVVHWHSDIIRQAALMRLYGPLQAALLRRATRIVVATPMHVEHSRWLAPHREKVEVIPFGLNLERFRPEPDLRQRAAEFRDTAQGRPVLLNIGRLVGYKGQRHAVEAMAGLDAELWLVGTGPLEAELRELARQNGVADRVRFWGDAPDADLPALLHAADVFVFPSVTPNEAFGLVLVEAMACGKPLVACSLKSGVPFVCRDGINGLLVPPGDSAGLRQAVARLLSSPALRERLGAAGRKLAEDEFSANVMLERTLALFRRLVAGGPRP